MLNSKTVIIGSIEYEITNACTCEVYDEDTDTATPSDVCYDCFAEDKSNLDYEIIKPWLSMNGIEEGSMLRVNGANMGWTHSSGYTLTEATAEGIVSALGINGEYILRFKLDNGALTVIRSSHDEMGARFEFRVATEEEIENN